ncbi:MAG: hypothetical protein ACKVX7_09655 [Planctomycetota bacterium]
MSQEPSTAVRYLPWIFVFLCCAGGYWISARLSDLEQLTRESGHGIARGQRSIDQLRSEVGERLSALEQRVLALEAWRAAPSVEPGAIAPSESALVEELAALRREFEDLRAGVAVNAVAKNRIASTSSFGEAIVWQPAPVVGNNPDAPNWGSDQIIGEPDTLTDGDRVTAWASLEPDGGREWLEAHFDSFVVPTAIVIRETYNPGAIIRVEALDAKRRYHTVWQGRDDPDKSSPAEFVVPYGLGFATQSIRITLDTSLVAGWNEIDAVALQTAEGRIWASASAASSSYSARLNPTEEGGN